MNGEQMTPNDWRVDSWDDVSVIGEHETENPGPEFDQIKGPLRMVAIVFISVVLLLGAGGWWVAFQLNPPGEPGVAVNFTVNDGDTVSSVSSRLAAEGIIRNPTIFRWYVRTRGGMDLSPGYYSIRPGDNAGRIMNTLATPPAQTFVSVTFPEGMTVVQMAQRLAAKMTFMSEADFLSAATDGSVTSTLARKGTTSLEGLLFPDTYQISGDDTEARVVTRLAQMMERVAKQVDLVAGAKARGYSPYEVLIIASLVEREAKVAADRPKIAQVIYNRLAAKMPLEIDASVKYGLDPAMSWSEMKATDSPYNTYLYKGLPPTPIANPGRASMEAALAPAGVPPKGDEACVGLPTGTKCRYMYYVLAAADGRHAFATTYEQHLVNVERARQAGLLP